MSGGKTSRRTLARASIAVGVLKNLGSRLSLDDRPPYERPEHDHSVDLDEPTGPVAVSPSTSSSEQP